MNEAEVAIEKLKSGEVFFFAGSGISYASNLPSAYAVLEHTVNALLPENLAAEEKSNICKSIQPEVFYESVIGMTQTYESLNIWKSLYKGAQANHQVECEPNLAHLFIAEYSNRNRLPIITTNFDSMFEQAAEALGVKYRVFLPSDAPPCLDEELLCICKVHGSIQDHQGEYSPQSLWMTMTQITAVNTKWIEYISGVMERKHLCFVGYSGRDIDLFPYLSEAPVKRAAKRIVWVNRFDGDYSDNLSRACNALRINLWPSELFELSLSALAMSEFRAKKANQDHENRVAALLTYLETDLIQKNLLSVYEKALMYCILLAKLGKYRKAYECALDLECNKLTYLTRPSSKRLLLLTCARLSHEISRYESCRAYAKQVLNTLKNKPEPDVNAELQARCLVSESLRMEIPNDMYFIQRKTFKDYLYILYVVGHFAYSSITNRIAIRAGGLAYSRLNAETQHELIEHHIRFTAIIQSVLGSPQRGWNNFVKSYLGHKWEDIREMSYRSGYSAGIANAGKFKYRLDPTEKAKAESANIYSLTSSATGAELLIRNEADKLLREKQYDKCRHKFLEYADMAKMSGNTLNEIKGIIGFAYSNQMEGKAYILPASLKQRYCALAGMVEGKRWEQYLSYVEHKISNEDPEKDESSY
ncbi:SIR2 family protein [Pseudoalteromonas sp. OOF1S-7]|uniref:SIR2 family protein n=1 Tax=Pseudoalteromonas sp. OOF1S-7 TaxID=2917757 RepID=UPI001EF6D0FB|nr:SIR2 family protein [Pseudoalteromonas sp. OOF1S-7]MCG7536806.1 SIR2 family protein [Pseudoalteromonas sp. OOF1S-7]